MKKLYIILYLVSYTFISNAQLDHFLISIYSYDYDNTPRYIPTGTSREEGNDYQFLKSFKDVNINCIN